jgi:hypothetical protein
MNSMYYEIQDLIRDNVQKARNVKKVYLGVPASGEIPRSSLPAIVIMPERQENEARGIGAGGSDTQVDTIQIMITLSTQDYLKFDDEEQPYLKEMYNIISELDSNGDYRTDTVLGTLRENNVLDGRSVFIDKFSIEWGFDDNTENPKILSILTLQMTSLPRRS